MKFADIERGRTVRMIFLIGIGCGIFNYLLYRVCMRDLGIENKRSMKNIWIAIGSILWAVLFSMLFKVYGYGPVKIIKYCLLMNILILIAYEDVREKRIPNRWLVYLIGIRGGLFLVETVLYPSMFIDNLKFILLGSLGSFAVLFIAYVISKHEIGLGDVKLFGVIGLFLGMGTTYFVILLSLIIAAVYSVIKLLKKQLKAKDEIAFGPFAAIGSIIILGLGF